MKLNYFYFGSRSAVFAESPFRAYRIWGIIGVLLMAVAGAFTGLSVVPLESHEIFVVQTTKEMNHRNDWIIPYFNGEPRLNKPPMNYWLTQASSAIFHAGVITDVDGRIPSALAGVWMAIMTVWCGRMLFGWSVGLWASALLATTTGFSEYTHSARPEMVYASLCATALALFIASWRTHNQGWKQQAAAWGMWACFGLATLTKGPHVPAAFLFSFVVILALHPASRSRIRTVLRPMSGMVILAAIAMPWWWAISSHLGMETLSDSELAGRRFRVSPFNILEPYYLYRTWGLLLPWVPLFPGAAYLIFKRSRYGYAARFIGLLILIGVVVLGFGGGKRDYYMLPYTVPLSLLMSLALRDAMALISGWLNLSRSRTMVFVLMTIGLFGATWIMTIYDPSRASSYAQLGCWLMLGITVLAAYVIVLRLSVDSSTNFAHVRAITIFSVMLVSMIGIVVRASSVMSSPQRWYRAEFGKLVADRTTFGDKIGIFDLEPAFVVYHGQQMVHVVSNLSRWADESKVVKTRTWLCFPSDRLNEVSGHVSLAIQYDVAECDDGRSWILGLVEPHVASHEPMRSHNTIYTNPELHRSEQTIRDHAKPVTTHASDIFNNLSSNSHLRLE